MSQIPDSKLLSTHLQYNICSTNINTVILWRHVMNYDTSFYIIHSSFNLSYSSLFINHKYSYHQYLNPAACIYASSQKTQSPSIVHDDTLRTTLYKRRTSYNNTLKFLFRSLFWHVSKIFNWIQPGAVCSLHVDSFNPFVQRLWCSEHCALCPHAAHSGPPPPFGSG